MGTDVTVVAKHKYRSPFSFSLPKIPNSLNSQHFLRKIFFFDTCKHPLSPSSSSPHTHTHSIRLPEFWRSIFFLSFYRCFQLLRFWPRFFKYPLLMGVANLNGSTPTLSAIATRSFSIHSCCFL